jgi:hypothetical protein
MVIDELKGGVEAKDKLSNERFIEYCKPEEQ